MTKRILFVHQHFRTPDEGGSTRSYEVASRLAREGFDVTLLSGHNTKRGWQEIANFRAFYFPIRYENSMGFLPRIWAFWRFVRSVKKFVRRDANFSIAYVMTTPLSTGFAALYMKRKYQIRFVFEVGDLWPQVPAEMGILRNKWILSWLFKKERLFYNEAALIIAMSPAIADYIQARSLTKTVTIPNFSDTEFFSFVPRTSPISVHDPLRILYCGTFGRANQLEQLLGLAEKCLIAQLPVEISLMGDGYAKNMLSREIKSKSLSNVHLLDHGSKSDVRDVLNGHDAVFVSFAPYPTLATGSPNKFFDGLAAGKLIIINFGGWIAQLINEYKLGIQVLPDVEDSEKRLIPFIRLENLQEAQKNARKLGETTYKKELLTHQISILIKELCS